MDFRRTTVADIAQQVATRALSAREVVQAALERIDRYAAQNGPFRALRGGGARAGTARYDAQIASFSALDGEAALAEAASIDARLAGGEDVGALAGVPLAVKDLEDAAGFVTSRGSVAYAGHPPAPADPSPGQAPPARA